MLMITVCDERLYIRINKLIFICLSISLFSCTNTSIKEKNTRIDSNTTIKYRLKEDKILSEEKILKVDEDKISGNVSKVCFCRT